MAFTKQDREKAVKRSLASSALEGLRPDPEFSKLLEQYIAGELTADQAREVIRAKFRQGNAVTNKN